MTIWVTPPQYMGTTGTEVPFPVNSLNPASYPGGKTIGEINYGQSSTCFVFAFHEDDFPGEFPAFHNLLQFSNQEKTTIYNEWASYNNYDASDLLYATAITPSTYSTSVPISYEQHSSSVVSPSGLSIGSNGQIVGNLTVRDSNKILFIKVQTTEIPVYAVNRTYYAYSLVKHGSEVFKLKHTVSTPVHTSNLYPDPSMWDSVGQYAPLADSSTRIFAIVLNARSSGDIAFITKPNLGTMKVGQQIGEEFNLIVSAVSNTGEDISYSIDPMFIAPVEKLPVVSGNVHACMPPGTALSADGVIYGTPGLTLANENEYTTITYQFPIVATTTSGVSVQQLFVLTVVPGYIRNNISVSLLPSRKFEREWFDLVSSEAFSDVALYRPSDDNYGIQRYPKVFIKDNLYGDLGEAYSTQGEKFRNIKQHLSDAFSSTPEINVNVGNLKYKTALGVNGVPQYEIIYKEITSAGRPLAIDIDSSHLNQQGLFVINGLKDNLSATQGSNFIDPLDSRYYLDMNESGMYADALPLWMTNPASTNGAVPGYFSVVPVVYVMPGESTKFFAAALEQNILNKFFNRTISFDNFILEYTLYPGRHYEYATLG